MSLRVSKKHNYYHQHSVFEKRGFTRGKRSLLTRFPDQLLRVRKNLPTTFPCEESHAAWLRLIAPLFRPDQILEQSLVRLHPPGLLTRLNAELRSWEQNPNSMKPPARSLDHRPKSRQGIYLADDEYGLLITDMTCSKWVLAPKDDPWD